MLVLKAKRKASQFEVYHHFGKMRKEVVALLLRDLRRKSFTISSILGLRTITRL